MHESLSLFNSLGNKISRWHEQDSMPEHRISSLPPKPLDYQGFSGKKCFKLEVYSINPNP